MAEPVEDDVSFLGTQETVGNNSPSCDSQVPSTEYHEASTNYRVPEYHPAGALRAPIVPSQTKQERKHSSGGADRGTPYSSSSPSTSPRTPDRSPNYNIDASGSTYALQVALRNMKERYHKLQKKMALIEDDNQRLISGKTELFGEIGKLQENSIKLREKNLQLNQEIHTKHQECCSLKEKFSTLSTENMNLTRQLAKTSQEKRRLTKQVNLLSDENRKLREKLNLITTQVKALPGGAGLALSATELSTPPRTRIVPLSEELDSFDDPPSRFVSSGKDTLDEYEQISSDELIDLDSTWGMSDNEDEQLVMSLQSATQRMKDLLLSLQKQNHSLLQLSPLFHSLSSSGGSHSGSSHFHANIEQTPQTVPKDGTLSQRDRELSAVTVNPSTQTQMEERIRNEAGDNEGVCQSRLATCGSVLSNSFMSARGINISPLTDDSGGDNNIHVEASSTAEERPHSPFDWRQVQVSDDEGCENDSARPDTRTVSTSTAFEDEEDRICPMCKAIFPQFFPQDAFESHVVSHFEVENGFEVIA